jgi:PBSX family phage terminase large subunit
MTFLHVKDSDDDADEQIVNISYVAKLQPLFEPKPFKIVHGGRAGTKSHTVAQALLVLGDLKCLRVVCVREIQKTLKDSALALLKDYIIKLGLSHKYTVLKSEIRHNKNGTTFNFTGLRDHNSSSIKSYEGVDICWLEEASEISEESWLILIPTIRKAGSEIWATFNAVRETDYVYKTFVTNTDPDAWVCKINYDENPWFFDDPKLNKQRLKLKNINYDLYKHVWLGECRSAAGLLFKRKWFKYYDQLPKNLGIYIASDWATTEDAGDYTVHGVFGISESGDIYIIDWWRAQTSPNVWIDQWLRLVKKYKPKKCFEESGVIFRALDATITQRMRETKIYAVREQLASVANKYDRALGFAARCASGTVYMPKNAEFTEQLVNELCSFNGEDGNVDDGVDVCTLVGRGIDQMFAEFEKTNKSTAPKMFTGAYYDYQDKIDEQKRKDFYK